MARFNVKQAVGEARAAAGTTAAAPSTKPAAGNSAPKKAPRGRGGQDAASGVKKPAAAGKKAPATTSRPAPAAPVTDDLAVPLPGELEPAPAPTKNEKRVAVPMSDDMRRELAEARILDEVQTTVRIRAMIELWQRDSRLRARVDKLAQQRSTELIAHRWPGSAAS